MILLLDGYFLEKPYGFGRYAHETIRALGRHSGFDQIHVAVRHGSGWQLREEYPNITWHEIPGSLNFVLWTQVVMPLLGRSLRADVVHYLYNTRALFTFGIPTVTTVHDTLMLRRGALRVQSTSAMLRAGYIRLVFQTGTLRKSGQLVSVSHETTKDLAALGVTAQTIENTVDGLFERRMQISQDGHAKRRAAPFLLHRGGSAAHRNTLKVIEAFNLVKERHPAVDLVILGVPDAQTSHVTVDSERVVFLPWQSEDELVQLYTTASVVVASSLAEGFGLPIIEGFAAGTPVITSDLSPMRDVAGGAARLVDPCSATSIAAAIDELLRDRELRERLVALGRQRSKHFDARQVAEKLGLVYTATAAGSRSRPK